MSSCLWPHGLQHARLPCPSPSPRACSNSSPSSWINHLILGHSLLLLPLIFPRIRVFSNQWALHIRWPKYWSFSFSIRPSNEYSGLISLQSKGVFKSILQHHSPKASIIWRSVFFFTVQLSHLYMTTGKTIALTTQTFVSKEMSLLFNMLSRFVIAFFSRSKCHLISWRQSPSAVILEPKKIVCHSFHCFPWTDRTWCHDLRFLNVLSWTWVQLKF